MHIILLCPFVWVTVKFCTSGRFIGNYKSDRDRSIDTSNGRLMSRISMWASGAVLTGFASMIMHYGGMRTPPQVCLKGISGSACVYLHLKISPVRMGNLDDLIVRESLVRQEPFLSYIRSNLPVTSSQCLQTATPQFHQMKFHLFSAYYLQKFNNSCLTKNERKQNHIPARSETTWILLLM